MLVLVIACQSNSQKVEKISLPLEDGKAGYYMELAPGDDHIKGVLILLPGFSQKAEDVFSDSGLPDLAHQNDLLVVGISTSFNLTANEEISSRITQILTDVLIRHKMDQEQFILGGFSAGGTIALRYSELCHETPGDYPVVPAAVFAVDSPVDIIAFWDYIARELNRNYSEVGMNEANHISKMLEHKYGKLPQNRAAYEKITPFDMASSEPGNEKYLLNIPIRTYHDVDIPWQLKNRRRGAMDANFFLSSELISRLLLQGNSQAEFIQSPIEGRRPNGDRHPHSWNIVDGAECVAWMLKAIN
jgi:pimeloyl-ACP methyl ester carboxylesterase